jgi:hypothetical protein
MNFTAEKIKSRSFLNPSTSIKDVQATVAAVSPQRRTSFTAKHEIYSHFLFLRLIFAILDPDPVDLINADPCGTGSTALHVGVCMHEHHIRRQAIKSMIRCGMLLNIATGKGMKSRKRTVPWKLCLVSAGTILTMFSILMPNLPSS